MVNDPHFDQLPIDTETVAKLLGVERYTLPAQVSPVGPPVAVRKMVEPLSDDEWEAVRAVLPKLPVPKPNSDFKDRTFIDAVLWWIEAKRQGYSWHRLPPELGPHSSRSHRARRWTELGWWVEIAEKLAHDDRISPERLGAFQRVAEDAKARKTSLLSKRARLTDAIMAPARSRF